MFVTTRDPGVRRRNKLYSNSKTARSSKLSLLSTFTTNTTGSGDSNSTVTQESYARSHRPRRRKTREHRSRRHPDEDKNSSVDVFDFLVDETSKSRESLSIIGRAGDEQGDNQIAAENLDDDDVRIEERMSATQLQIADVDESETVCSDVEDRFNDDDDDVDNIAPDEAESESEAESDSEPELDPEPEGYYRSMSDSGISMGSASSLKHPLPIVYEEPVSRPTSRAKQGNELMLVDPRWHWPATSPQPPHDGYIPPPCPQPPPAVIYDVPMYAPYPYPHPPYTPYGTPPPPIPEADIRESLAIREPTGHSYRPSHFRSFSKVSNRIMLQMQDDIADLEDELDLVDKEIDAVAIDIDHSSSSSTNEKRERKLREEEICGELHVKLDQYYHALEMMKKVDDISLPSTSSDLSNHYAWLQSRVLQPDRIRRLVGNDLRTFLRSDKQVGDPNVYAAFQPRYLAYTALVNGIVPLMLFKVVSGVSNRLILLLMTVVVGSTVQSRTRVRVGRDELTCTLVCICITAFAAVFL